MPIMRLIGALPGAIALMASAATAQFPPPAELPSQTALPDPLVSFDGTKVATREQWETKRKPELKALFEHYMYGRYPAKPERVTAKVLFEDSEAFGGKATLKEVELTLGPPK